MSDEEDKKPENIEPKEESKQDDSEVLEFEFNEDGEEDLKKTLKKLRADLKQAKKEKEEYLTGWQKERADFINYKKQEDDRRTVFSEAIRERILTRFLSVIDSFNMAFASKEAWDKIDETWRKGVEHIYAQMNGIFEEYGVKPVGEAGENFDPNIHQSIDVVETDNKDLEHKVATVIQKGYKLGERVIRPARVNIYEFKESEQ
ncbi:MAG: Protein GrpE [Candidatus Nomurabacteria bacterium GW2011_GWC2_41_8]|uniref:Protein GrpE n=2 Tax=Candidatus Nomuraibacteriota TaxID=1752729 RepID=A0A1F6YD31_9BACT|nr:MAG: Protein GrpE [Candidatus Nomurabacteria bacterium GW2011_GWC2_41_8]OGI67488.1 MAG: nucleotide exchange factor GrpE [Candidatus Nomurabacteria bacterium RIFCSPHIGHO2_01_FULL_41_91]OGI80909.1 MAG: nucleotide exchange factor GrpE [Candidatus Nomurabacteria bacterium RIFCSPHIGHO2_02_FULL_41_52]OGI84707.1 MAG: nucleotide exchange factor GrpE [Candidatus Nomurabacteria bacterium RIFCSPHIGHO2_12_FULL_42_19]OGI93495.1 MAG: nucleotide exchange factor GrpE [Candidatus Nomurabacteria bacterium RIF